MTVIFRNEAADELDAAFEHYQAVHEDLAADLLVQFRRGVDSILTHPNAWQSLDAIYCRYRINRFPYGIVYRVDAASGILVIVAFMNLSQRPDYWRERGR
jgi:plasmid stabilization system protein ParE